MFLSSNIYNNFKIFTSYIYTYKFIKNITCASRGFCSFVFFVRSRINRNYFLHFIYFFVNDALLNAIIMCLSFFFFLHSINTFSYYISDYILSTKFFLKIIIIDQKFFNIFICEKCNSSTRGNTH